MNYFTLRSKVDSKLCGEALTVIVMPGVLFLPKTILEAGIMCDGFVEVGTFEATDEAESGRESEDDAFTVIEEQYVDILTCSTYK